MAWTAVHTYVVGEVVTAANLNTFLSANTDHLKTMLAGSNTELISPKAWGDRPVAVPPQWVTAGGMTLYTCPANTYAIVTEIRLVNTTSTARWCVVSARGYTLFTRNTTFPVPPYNMIAIPCWVWLQPGETIGMGAEVDGAIYGSATVWEVPSSLTGITLKRNYLTSVAADTWTTLIGPDAGKTLVVKHVSVQAGGSQIVRVALGAEAYYHHASFGPVAPNETVHFNNEIIVVSTGNLAVHCAGAAGGHVIAHGWQV